MCQSVLMHGHHGYLGMIVHFISKDWNCVEFWTSCSQFDERYTAKNISNKIETIAEEWEISSKIGVCLRDNPVNVKAAFNVPSCNYESAECLNHSLQLAIKKKTIFKSNHRRTDCKKSKTLFLRIPFYGFVH